MRFGRISVSRALRRSPYLLSSSFYPRSLVGHILRAPCLEEFSNIRWDGATCHVADQGMGACGVTLPSDSSSQNVVRSSLPIPSRWMMVGGQLPSSEFRDSEANLPGKGESGSGRVKIADVEGRGRSGLTPISDFSGVTGSCIYGGVRKEREECRDGGRNRFPGFCEADLQAVRSIIEHYLNSSVGIGAVFSDRGTNPLFLAATSCSRSGLLTEPRGAIAGAADKQEKEEDGAFIAARSGGTGPCPFWRDPFWRDPFWRDPFWREGDGVTGRCGQRVERRQKTHGGSFLGGRGWLLRGAFGAVRGGVEGVNSPSFLHDGVVRNPRVWLDSRDASTPVPSSHARGYGTIGSSPEKKACGATDTSVFRGRGEEMIKQPWLERICPAKLWPYVQLARLDRPIGTWLLIWPCFWSISLAAPAGAVPDLKLLALFGMGAVLLRGAGCTINDLIDRDIDSKVSRTRIRPLASGVLNTNQAVLFLGTQLLLGLGILLQLNQFSQILGASSLLLVGTYPLMKRFTYWPQAFLGFTINWGALLGWAAVCDNLDLSVAGPLYLSCVTWTLVYDTIYAHQDKHDDVHVGVKSTALRFGDATPYWLTGFSTSTVGGLAWVGSTVGLGWPFYPALAAASAHLAWQLGSVDFDNRADCLAKFVSNKWFGGIVFSGIVLGKLTAG